MTDSTWKSSDLRRSQVPLFSRFQHAVFYHLHFTILNFLRSSFYSNILYSKPILIILDVLKSFNVPLSDSVMTETCSRQTTACSRQTCSSCGKSACLCRWIYMQAYELNDFDYAVVSVLLQSILWLLLITKIITNNILTFQNTQNYQS